MATVQPRHMGTEYTGDKGNASERMRVVIAPFEVHTFSG